MYKKKNIIYFIKLVTFCSFVTWVASLFITLQLEVPVLLFIWIYLFVEGTITYMEFGDWLTIKYWRGE